jgi:mRNA interferase MazF
MSGVTRGDVFYIERTPTYGSEQQSGRPAIIVSNDMNNEFSPTVEVVYLTTQPKNNLPTHVTITSSARTSTALCEQITTISRDRLGDWCARLTDAEIVKVETALLVSLGLNYPENCEMDDDYGGGTLEADIPVVAAPSAEVETIKAERDLYKQLYESILDRVVPVKKGKV